MSIRRAGVRSPGLLAAGISGLLVVGVSRVPDPSCTGPHIPLRRHRHRHRYATMLAEKMAKHGTTAWLINTGWTGGK